jgi:hypothetical protein
VKQLISIFFMVFVGLCLSHAQNADSTQHIPVVESATLSPMKDSIRQVDLVDYLAKIFKIKNSDEKRNKGKFRFSLFPSESKISGGKTVFTTVNVAFLLGDKLNTNVSTIYFVPYISFNGKYGIQLMPNIWLNKNSWNFTGEYFLLNYPQETWGLGGDSPEAYKTMVDYKHLRVHQNAMKGVWPHLAIGLGYALDQHYDIKIEENETGSIILENYPELSSQSVSSGMTLPVVYDSRRNSLNAQQGFLGAVTYSFFHPFFGSDNEWQSLFIDTRKYFPVIGRRSNIIALRSYYWTILSGKVPYLDLPANRWEPGPGSSSRGIQQNRYRSNALLYFESEYRFGISANGLWGGVVFSNITSASQYNTQNFTDWHPAAGAGVRMKFNKYSRTNVTLDYGFSKGYQSVYLNIGEAF